MDTKLETYNKKRNFKSTPEPQGKSLSKNDDLRFVVQLHQASQLHYDFRIELNGVLKSWAIPKGPPTETKQKHLAMMTEDHPYDYKDFEGVIPEGAYGAGTVMIWDEGYYIPEVEYGKGKREPIEDYDEGQKIMKEGIKKGELKFTLFGSKLHGSFALVRTRIFGSKPGWLLIKHQDKYVRKGYDANTDDISARSGMSMKQITERKS